MNVDLSYAEVEGMLIAVLRVPSEARMRLRSRVQHLQRSQFPPGVNVGRGMRHRYDRKASFQLLFAFVLMDIGWTSLAAAHFLEEQWESFEPLIEKGLRGDRRTADQRREGRLLLCPNALNSISPGVTGSPPTRVMVPKGAALTTALASCVIDVVEITRIARDFLAEIPVRPPTDS